VTWAETRAHLPLDDSQDRIATAPANLRQLVLSPPGTGKTQVVVARLVHLICEQGIAPREVAVLCFTRAAAAEISARVTGLVEKADLHDDLRFISIRTFDSFATRLLLAADPGLELEDDGYDARIGRAVEALEDPAGSESLMIKRVRHLIVDEIQDLVGIRAKLVKVLLSTLEGGFTLLGDPAQAIYGWSVANDKEAITPTELIAWLRAESWAAPLIEPKVEVNYRSEGASAKIGRELRESLLSADDGDGGPLRRLRGVIEGLESAGSAISADGISDARPEGSLCVLCRSNGEVMQVASLLSLKGIDAHTRANPEDRGHPAWLGRVFGTYLGPTIGRTQFLERWSDLVGPDRGPEPLDAWRWLKYLEGEPGQGLSVRLLHRKLLAGHRLPDSADAFVSTSAPAVSVSTIHASKGREFDHVVVLEPTAEAGPGASSSLEEARVLFVASTRARGTLRRLERAGLPRLWTVDVQNGRKRWVASVPSRSMYFFEIGLPGDYDGPSGVGTWDHGDEAAARGAQEVLWTSIRPGATVDVHHIQQGRFRFYKVYHTVPGTTEGTKIGQLSLGFLKDLRLVLGAVMGPKWSYPLHMNGLRVATLVTEVLPLYPKNVHEPFATSRFCLGIRLRGMGYLCKR
jgi:hypothetical protein